MNKPFFSKPNTKLKKLQKKIKKKVYSFDLLSGWSCPFANICFSKTVGEFNHLRIQDGPNTKVRCFSASQEVLYKYVFLRRSQNLRLVKQLCSKRALLTQTFCDYMPPDANVIRFHVGGDFFSKNYMRAMINVAKRNPHIIFYAYTKAVLFWKQLSSIAPPNFRMTISIGGKQDRHITGEMNTCRIIHNKNEKHRYGLEIDYDDSHAYFNKSNFLTLIHGIQPKVKTLNE